MESETPRVPIQNLVKEWLRLDQDEETRAEIEQLVTNEDDAELEARLRHRIRFGTAGLRASMSAGFSRMNSLTVIQASQGLAEYALKTSSDAREMGVVIGRDARHNSEKFAKLAAAAFLAKGFKVYYLRLVHTPLVPFAVARHKAAVGVMITASHNPAADNGYKVYMSNGCQIIPPHDQRIAEQIDGNLEPITWDVEQVSDDNPRVLDGLKDVGGEYLRAVAGVWMTRYDSRFKDVKFTYTPMHGVGLPYFRALLQHLEVVTGRKVVNDMHVVKSQARPDPEFPTVQFPNPEEKDALDEAIKTADTFGDSIILANDPDADRFAVAVKAGGEWKQLTGNQLGVLLASFVWSSHAQSLHVQGKEGGDPAVMLVSAVSSRMIFHVAKGLGERDDGAGPWCEVEETLTGFKWLGNRAKELSERPKKTEVLFAYEEAIGYMLPKVVFDKDGIAAAALFLAACRYWQWTEGISPWQKLQELYESFGYFEEANTYLITPSPQVTAKVFEEIRSMRPLTVGTRNIVRWRDLTKGTDTATADGVPVLPVDETAQMITCELEGKAEVVFTVRGSGTEPKIKLYIEAKHERSSEEAKEAADSVLQDLLMEWFKPEENGLRLA